MTLLQEIIEGASDDTVPVATLLRKLKVLAARTEAARLRDWVHYEVDGYPSADLIPPYRGPFEPPVLGHFIGSFGREIKNFQIPPSTFPEDMRDNALFKVWLLDPVAQLEEMAQHTVTRFGWPPDGAKYYNYGVVSGLVERVVNEDFALVEVVRPLPKSYFVAAVDAVRNRVLDLALELEQVAPQAGEPGAASGVRSEAQQVINNYNFHGSSNVAIGSSNVTQSVGLPEKGDEKGLLKYLAAVGVPPADLVELEEALIADAAEAGETQEEPGARVTRWTSRITSEMATGVTAGLVVEALKAFFG